MFLGDLALEMGIPVGEITGRNGNPPRMSAWELTVFWPNFFAVRKREQQRAIKAAEDK